MRTLPTAAVINYEASAGLTHQPIHRDGALLSCNRQGRSNVCSNSARYATQLTPADGSPRQAWSR